MTLLQMYCDEVCDRMHLIARRSLVVFHRMVVVVGTLQVGVPLLQVLSCHCLCVGPSDGSAVAEEPQGNEGVVVAGATWSMVP